MLFFIRYRVPRRIDAGFALISSLVLLVLLCVLALACVQLSVIEKQQSRATLADSCAKANARLAIQIAITQLQQYTGRDQTVSSRADLLDSRKIPQKDTDPALKNPNYTVAYQTEAVTAEGTNEGIRLKKVKTLPAHLVSGNEFYNLLSWNSSNYPEGYTTAESAIPHGKAVTLHKSATNTPVTVPRVTLPNQGSYAYWISDEGCKARINTEDTERKFNQNIALSETHSSQDYNSLRAPSQLRPLELPQIATPERNISLGTISILSEKHKDLLYNHPHCYTAHSRSVLIDLQNGGLKKNLTAAVNASDAEFQALTTHSGNEASQPSPVFLYKAWPFPPENEPLSFSHYAAIPWELLRSYIRRPEWESNITGESPKLLAHLGSLAHKLPYYWQSSKVNYRQHMDARLVRRQPILTRFQIGFDFSIQYNGIEAGEEDSHWHSYIVRQHFMPVAIFWNPYNVDLTLTEPIEFQLYLDRNWSSGKHNTELSVTPENHDPWKTFSLVNDSKNEAPNWSAPTTGNGSFIYPFHPNGNTASTSELCRLSFHIPPCTIPSGKTATFSAPNGNQLLKYSRGSPNMLGHGYSAGSSFYSKNAKLYIQASSETSPQPNTPTLKITRYPTEGGAERTRLQVTNHSSFQRINWDFFNIIGPSNIEFIPQDIADDEPLVLGSVNGSQTPQFTATLIRKFPEISHHIGNGASWVTATNKIDTNAFNAPWNIHFGNNPSRYGAYGAHPSGYDIFTAPPQFLSGISIGASPLIHPELTASGEAFVGHSDRFSTGSNTAIQMAIPRHETRAISLAHLSQLNTSKWVSNYNADQSNASATDAFNATTAIGNSFLPPNIPPNHTKNIVQDKHAYSSSSTSSHYDQSFNYNHTLWDRYFLTGHRSQDTLDTTKRLNFCPNKNIEALEPLDTTHWNDPHLAASQLLLRGGFNVNSTSVKAWEAILSVTRGLQASNGVEIASNLTPFPRLQYIEASAISSPPENASEKSLYNGSTLRALTDLEIRELAEAIVLENKIRGPAPTLSQWINRSLSPEHHYRKFAKNLPLTTQQVCYEGTLQAAINSTSINGIFNTVNCTYPEEIIADPSSLEDFQHGKLNTLALKYHSGYGAPATLTQADILQSIGHLLSARSDTFTIRAYGEYRNAKGKILSTAYCEAIVQRFPEYYDNRNSSDIPPNKWQLGTEKPLKGNWTKNQELNELNYKLGRRYKIIRFRWLHPNEI
ncbi:hypothetical protein [Rubritalea sp.]|uniref:hypothetical protein n=1 Tax=Rubritalea sp. TaxID=2109375 RepID=UPI003EF689B0